MKAYMTLASLLLATLVGGIPGRLAHISSTVFGSSRENSGLEERSFELTKAESSVTGMSSAQAAATALGWTELPNTKLRSVCPPNNFGGSGYDFTSFCDDVTEAWNGGVFDTKRNRLIIWGGGHNGYFGNEIYALNLGSNTIERLTDPGLPLAPMSGCPGPEAIANGRQPNSRHTYDGIAYMEKYDKMFVFGGSKAPCGWASRGTWAFDFETRTWEQKNPTGIIPGGEFGVVTAYDPNTGKVFLHDNWNLFSYDYATDHFERLGPDHYIGIHSMATLDPVRRKMVIVSRGDVWIYDIGPLSTYQPQLFNTIGGDSLVDSVYPGLAYDPTTDRIVGWNGGNTVYSLDMDTGVWTPITYSGGPGAALPNGTYNRWSYSPTSGVFVVLNSVDDNAYTLRLSEAVSDFELRCAGPDVIRCYDFDDLTDLEQGDPNTWGNGSSRMLPGGGNCPGGKCYALDTSVKVSGASSLRFTIPSNSPADTSGSFKLNFQDGYSQQVGEGESVFVQFRYRVSPEMLTPFPGGGGFKLIIIGEGDQAANPSQVWSCTELESVITTNNIYMGPTFYHSCGRFVNLEFWDGTQVRLQHQGPPYCYYPNDPQQGCWRYVANQWMTFQVGIDVGSWNTPSSRIRVWAAGNGQASVLIYDSNVSHPGGFTLYNNPGSGSGTYPGAKFGKIWLLPYNTGKDPSFTHPTGYVWYDDLIISRTRIPEPAGSSPPWRLLDGFGAVHGATGAQTPYFGFDVARDLELTTTGFYVLDGLGGVHAGGGAATLSPMTPYFGFDAARDLEFVANGHLVLDGFGALHAGGGASVPMPQTPYFGFDIARDFESAGSGYYVLDGFGGVHAGGGASFMSPASPYFGFDIARDLELLPTGCYVLEGFGGVHSAGGAAPPTGTTPYFGFDIARDLELASTGFYVLDGFGGVHPGGGAPPLSPAAPYFGFDIARDLELTF